jgi:hypothetical protein
MAAMTVRAPARAVGPPGSSPSGSELDNVAEATVPPGAVPPQTGEGWRPGPVRARARLPAGVEAPSLPGATPATTNGGRPLRIADILQTYGWPLNGWQAQFLIAADNADKGTRGQGTQGDGQLTVGELKDFAYHPGGAKLLSSLALESVQKAVGTGPGRKSVADLPEPWMRDVAAAAAQTGPGPAGTVSGDEVAAYAKRVAAGGPNAPAEWVTNQRLQVLYHCLARMTGESDAMSSPSQLGGTDLIFPAMTLAFDRENNVAVTASNTYFAADAGLAEKTPRTNDFYNALDGTGVNQSVFEGPESEGGRSWFDFRGQGGRGRETFDKGHLLGNQNFDDPRDRAASFATENMHAQVPASNSGVWLEKVEVAARQRVVESKGRGVDVSGVLFADKDYNPLPPDQIPWIAGRAGAGAKGALPEGSRIPVPTHTWKALLVQSGDVPPKFSVRCYIVENRFDLDRTSDPKIVSLKEMERILGGKIRLFHDLPEEIRSQIENDPNATFAAPINFIARDQRTVEGEANVMDG